MKKSTIEKAVKFLETVPEDQWCKFTQTDKHGRHCAIGHLGVNPKSPFYDESIIFLGECVSDGTAIDLQLKCNNKLGIYLAEANNYPEKVDAKNPKEASIKLLKFLAEVI